MISRITYNRLNTSIKKRFLKLSDHLAGFVFTSGNSGSLKQRRVQSRRSLEYSKLKSVCVSCLVMLNENKKRWKIRRDCKDQ